MESTPKDIPAHCVAWYPNKFLDQYIARLYIETLDILKYNHIDFDVIKSKKRAFIVVCPEDFDLASELLK